MRLKGYDYSSPGQYFLTICVQNREHLFGKVINGEMILNDAGRMVDKWYLKLENKYPNIKCDEYQIMPNHFHCIIEIVKKFRGSEKNPEKNADGGAHTGTPPQKQISNGLDGDAHTGASPQKTISNAGTPLRGCPDNGHPETNPPNTPKYGPHNIKYNASIFDMMDWFKTMTTNEYIRGVKTKNWPRYYKRLWQSRYWNHIIHSKEEYFRIKNYIKNNPRNWERDKFEHE